MRRRAERLTKLAFVTVTAVALAGCSGGGLSGGRTITAQFENANGLYEGNAVAVLGMHVGKVARITPRGSGVEVVLRVDAPVRLPADVQAVLISNSVLTDRHIELAPVYRGGPTLPDNAVLDRAHTKNPVEFDSLLAMSDRLAISLSGDGAGGGPIANLMDIGAAATEGNGDLMREALDKLSQALRVGGDDGAATRDAVTGVVTDLDALTTVAADNEQTLRDFASGVHRLTDLLADQNLGTGDTGAKLRDILVATADLMARNKDRIAALTANAGTLTTTMADYNDNLAEFFDVFPLAADNVYNAIDRDIGAIRASVDLNRMLLDGQMVKEVCNLLGLKELGCATGTMRDLGPDFGIVRMLEIMAEMDK
ncbi:MCE family protein [Nocardia sp. NEAU-351]|uniref:MCE family protein n=2 Tax=Nocardia bovistercoris TaxID=2785916 RepID=A0A931IB27_9NOCA|nr:MCE family protein [Nocardia bovistercoris]